MDSPYYAVIFSSVSSQNQSGYAETAKRMDELAAEQPGYLGIESVHAAGESITVSFWESEDAIAAWKADAEHTIARETGRRRWYDSYVLRVAKVEREYDWARSGDQG